MEKYRALIRELLTMSVAKIIALAILVISLSILILASQIDVILPFVERIVVLL